MTDLPPEALAAARRAFPVAVPHALAAALQAAAPHIAADERKRLLEVLHKFREVIRNGPIEYPFEGVAWTHLLAVLGSPTQALRDAGLVEAAAAGAKHGPRIVCLCGSTRFKDAFRAAERDRTLAGEVVLTVNDLADGDENRHVNVPIPPERKVMLDALHLHKITLADYVYVLNVRGYVGESVRREIEFAEKLGKPVVYLEPLPEAAT